MRVMPFMNRYGGILFFRYVWHINVRLLNAVQPNLCATDAASTGPHGTKPRRGVMFIETRLLHLFSPVGAVCLYHPKQDSQDSRIFRSGAFFCSIGCWFPVPNDRCQFRCFHILFSRSVTNAAPTGLGGERQRFSTEIPSLRDSREGNLVIS